MFCFVWFLALYPGAPRDLLEWHHSRAGPKTSLWLSLWLCCIVVVFFVWNTCCEEGVALPSFQSSRFLVLERLVMYLYRLDRVGHFSFFGPFCSARPKPFQTVSSIYVPTLACGLFSGGLFVFLSFQHRYTAWFSWHFFKG